MYVVTGSIILYIICVVTNKPKMAGYYLILYYCALFECHTCHLNHKHYYMKNICSSGQKQNVTILLLTEMKFFYNIIFTIHTRPMIFK